MNDIADRMAFPTSPEEMYLMLAAEDEAKTMRCLTHAGLSGFLLVQDQMRTDRMLYGVTFYDMSTAERVDPSKVTPVRPDDSLEFSPDDPEWMGKA